MKINEKLIESKKYVEENAKFWNRNALSLAFGFCSAVFLISFIELFKIIAKDYEFAWGLIGKNLLFVKDYYLIGIFSFFIFGLITTIISAIKIDKSTKYYNNLLKDINEQVFKK